MGRVLGGSALRSRPTLDEELGVTGAEVANHGGHGAGGNTEAGSDLGGGGPLGEVRAEDLVASLRCLSRGGEELRALSLRLFR